MAHEPASEVKHHRRAPNALTFRLEYFPDQIGPSPDGDSRSTPLKNWDRVFVISDRLTLEQFASVIIDLLAWDEDHLYEFHIADTVYVHREIRIARTSLLWTRSTHASRARFGCTT
jgi:hypothetical protein